MSDEPKGTTLENLEEHVCLNEGTPVNVLSGGNQVKLTRKIAIIQALESYSDAAKGDKFKAFDLGMRFSTANGTVEIDSEESELVKSALEKAWPQPGIFVPLCRWLEGA